MADASQSSLAASQSLNKACEPCRALKVRCLPAVDGPDASCQRCIKFNRRCVYAPPHRKKQRKRTDARVTELEKEIFAMRLLLQGQSGVPPSSMELQNSPASRISHSRTAGLPSQTDSLPSDVAAQTDSAGLSGDLIDRGIITIEEARQFLLLYRNVNLTHLPLVAIQPETTADELRISKPILFKAIVTTAAAKARPEIFTGLSTEMIGEYVQRVMMNGEKTLELVQAISITSAWYHPTDKWATFRFYDYITLASTMAMDINLGDKENPQAPHEPSEVIERKRALVGCFTHSSIVAFGMRRPNTLPFTTYMGEILEELSTKEPVLPSDKVLCGLARLFKIADEISATFSLTDAGREGHVSDHQLQLYITTFAHKLQAWRDFYRVDQLYNELYFLYHFVTLVLHEMPLHQVYPTTWFRPPHFLCRPKPRLLPFGPVAGQSISVACSSAQTMVDIYLAQPVERLRSGPNYLYAGLTVSLMTLVAVSMIPDVSVQAGIPGIPGMYFDLKEATRLLDASISKSAEAAGDMEYRIPSMFAVALMRLRRWLAWILEPEQQLAPATELPPFSIFAGPDDHPCLKGREFDELYASRSPSSDDSPSALANQGGSGKVASSPRLKHDTLVVSSYPVVTNPQAFVPSYMTIPRDVFASNSTYDENDFGWIKALEEDYSTVLDPSMFDPSMHFWNPPGPGQ